MNDDERRRAGTRVRRQVLGDAHVDLAEARTNALSAELHDLIKRYAWGEIWTRPGLDIRTRRVLVIGTLLALGRWEEFEMHVRAAVTEGGFSADDVKEIVQQQAIYCGIPAAHAALARVETVLGEGAVARRRRSARTSKKK
jgi:4-carboxymuconolactone decarboxylase/3-oxoadipate enol-lactonase/4-carboxymuconolactone decarboxylase